jgi:hypothetical protein
MALRLLATVAAVILLAVAGCSAERAGTDGTTSSSSGPDAGDDTGQTSALKVGSVVRVLISPSDGVSSEALAEVVRERFGDDVEVTRVLGTIVVAEVPEELRPDLEALPEVARVELDLAEPADG